jgi:MFS family permease
MPRVPHPAPVRIGASADQVRAAAITTLGAVEEVDGTLAIPTEGVPSSNLATVLTIAPDADGSLVTARRRGHIDIPFFGWFFVPLTRIAGNRAAAHAIGSLQHAFDEGPEPAPPRGVFGLPNVAFTSEQATLLAAASAAVAVTSFASAIFGQLAGPIGDSFGASDATLSNALAITRLGAILALFATALADRRGRRRAILIGVVGTAIACALSAVAPTLVVFTAAQVLQRAFVNTTLIVAGIAVIEEAP